MWNKFSYKIERFLAYFKSIFAPKIKTVMYKVNVLQSLKECVFRFEIFKKI